MVSRTRRVGARAASAAATRSDSSSRRILRSENRRAAEHRIAKRSALAVDRSPLNIPYLDLSAAPRALAFGSGINQRYAPAYAGLLDSGVFPALAPAKNDTASEYLKRCAQAFAEQYPNAPITLSIFPAVSTDRYMRENDPLNNCLIATVHADGPSWVNSFEWDRELAAIDSLLCSSLYRHISAATAFTINVYTPLDTLNDADWIWFSDDYEEWWHYRKDEVASDIGKPIEDVTNAEVRAYIAKHKVLTPSRVRKSLGRHHAGFARNRRSKALTMPACERRAAQLPKALRERVLLILEGARTFYKMRQTLYRMLNENDRAAWENFANPPQPSVIIDSADPDDGANYTYHVMDERWQQFAQTEGFGPSYVFTIDANPKTIERVTTIARVYERAGYAGEALFSALGEPE